MFEEQFLIKGPKYREVRPINLEKVTRCKLEDLDNCISSWCYKNGADLSFWNGPILRSKLMKE